MHVSSNELLLLHCALTWFMVGLIWTIQIVHYPLMGEVGTDRFSRYSLLHNRRTSWIVGPVMVVELLSGVYLWWWGVRDLSFAVSLLLLLLIWGSTALVQVPLHASFASGFQQTSHQRLVWSNWTRTIAWSLRGVLVLMVLGGRCIG